MGIQDTMQNKRETFIGAGYVLANGHNMGNAVSAQHDIEVNKLRLASRAPGGGDYDTYEQVNGVTATVVLSDFTDDNLLKALRAKKVDFAAAPQVETITVSKGALCTVSALIDESQQVEVKSTDEAQTYTAGDDYELTDVGIIPKESGAIAVDEVKISYTSKECTALEMLAGESVEFKLSAYVKNETNGATHLLEYFRFRPDIQPSMPIFSDDFGQLTLTGTVLADESKGAGQSKFMRIVKTASQKAV